jgi:hypothetical protein
LNGELSETERISLEKEMETDMGLRKEVEFMRMLPKAVRFHSETSLRNQLKEIEARLPKVQFEPEVGTVQGAGSPRLETSPPKPISRSLWIRYAVAASVLLLVTIFIFRDELFKTGINQSQVAQNRNDTLKQRPKNVLQENPVAVTALSITKIEDEKFGFVKNQLERKIVIVQQTDSSVLREFTTGRPGAQVQYGLYRLVSDTLFINAGELESSIRIFDFDVKAQSGDMIDSTGQMLHYDKPVLHGLYLLRSIHFYKIIKTENYAPLVPAKESELALLKFYTAK